MVIPAFSAALSGVGAGVERLNRAAERISLDGAGGDLAGNLIDLTRAQHDVKANLVTLRAADEMIGTLLDVLG